MSGRDALTAFLRAQASAPAGDPDTYCGAMLAAWFVAETGRRLPEIDPTAGLYRAMCRACAALDLVATDAPRRGDVAVVRAGNAIMGAICLGHGWAARSRHGVMVIAAPDVLRAWRIV